MQKTNEHAAFNQKILNILVAPAEGEVKFTVDMAVLDEIYENKEPSTYLLGADFSPAFWCFNSRNTGNLATIIGAIAVNRHHTFILPISEMTGVLEVYGGASDSLPPNLRFSLLYKNATELPEMVNIMAQVTDRFMVSPLGKEGRREVTLNKKGEIVYANK
jgi:hypothetical protein